MKHRLVFGLLVALLSSALLPGLATGATDKEKRIAWIRATTFVFADDIFVGGRGNDVVASVPGGRVVGGPGHDSITSNVYVGGLFVGGPGNDLAWYVQSGSVFVGGPGKDVAVNLMSTFKGGPGNDRATFYDHPGSDPRFYGKKGDDRVSDTMCLGRFIGGPDDDKVEHMGGGSFHGKKGFDRIGRYEAGRYWSVERVVDGPVAC